MTKYLSEEELASKHFAFTEEAVRFGLFSNNHVILLLDDREMTKYGIEHIIRLTGASIVKVHALNTCETKNVLSGYSHKDMSAKSKITADIANRMQKIPLNPSFETNLTPNIPRLTKFEVRKSIFIHPDSGLVVPHMDRLNSTQKRIVATFMGATEFVVDLVVEQKILSVASQYRSAPTNY